MGALEILFIIIIFIQQNGPELRRDDVNNSNGSNIFQLFKLLSNSKILNFNNNNNPYKALFSNQS